jgi:hypothetical protein
MTWGIGLERDDYMIAVWRLTSVFPPELRQGRETVTSFFFAVRKGSGDVVVCGCGADFQPLDVLVFGQVDDATLVARMERLIAPAFAGVANEGGSMTKGFIDVRSVDKEVIHERLDGVIGLSAWKPERLTRRA